MDNEMAGLSALDPRVAAADKFIQDKKIPPDQVPAFLLSMGQDPRLAGLVMRFRKLKQATEAQKNAPQGQQTTAAQDIHSAYDNMKRQEVEQAVRERQRMSGLATVPAPTLARAGFAGGGIVAFAGDDGSLVQSNTPVADLSKLSQQDLEAMSKSQDTIMAQRAVSEMLRRTGYVDIGKKYAEAFRGGIEGTPLIRYDSRPLPSYMYDEQGNVKKAEGPRAGIAGVKETGLTRWVTPEMTNEWNQQAGTPEQRAQVKAEEEKATRKKVSDEGIPYAGIGTYGGPRGRGGPRKPLGATVEEEKPKKGEEFVAAKVPGVSSKQEKVKEIGDYEDELAKIYKARGIGKAGEEYRQYLTQEQEKAKKGMGVDKNLALAQAGFAAMQAASQPGGTFGGALGTFGTKYASDLAALRQREQAMNREMRDAQYRLAQADEAQAQGRIRDAMGLRKDAQASAQRAAEHRDTINMQGAVLASQERRFQVQQANALAIAEARNAATIQDANARLFAARNTALRNLAADQQYQDAINVMSEAGKKSGKEAKAEYDKAKATALAIRSEYLSDIEDAMKGKKDKFGDMVAVGDEEE